MEVFVFEKCLTKLWEEFSDVLQCTDKQIPASQVRSEWSYHIELQIEPAGWDALWKISRAYCEELKIKYPTIVYGTVKNVLFKELKAVFTVNAVEDDLEIELQHVVPLEDLWPTKQQENDAIYIEQTANCLDSLRFFYKHIWMPWDNDNDDDLDWAEKHLKSRVCFYFDLKKEIKPSLASHIRTLITEAHYIQQQKEGLETDISDEDDELNSSNKSHVRNLMRLHLRLTTIKTEIDILENPKMRVIYEEIRDREQMGCLNKNWKQTKTSDCHVFIVMKSTSLVDHINYLKMVTEIIGVEKIVKILSTLQDCIDAFNTVNEIYIPEGCHAINFLEYLNEGGLIRAITSVKNPIESKLHSEIDLKQDAVIITIEDNSILLMFNGDFTIENITLDCRNVRTGIVVRKGKVTLRNCVIVGDELSSTNLGIAVMANSSLMLQHCLIKNFATAINCYPDGNISIESSIIHNCQTGIECVDNCAIKTTKSKIMNSKQYGIIFKSQKAIPEERKSIYNDFSEINSEHPLSGDCVFQNNTAGNIIRYNKDKISIVKNFESMEDEDCDIIRSFTTSNNMSNRSMSTSTIGDTDQDSYIELD